MEISGIKDPIETKSRGGRESADLKRFRKTFAVDQNGCCEIHVPWKETKHDL